MEKSFGGDTKRPEESSDKSKDIDDNDKKEDDGGMEKMDTE